MVQLCATKHIIPHFRNKNVKPVCVLQHAYNSPIQCVATLSFSFCSFPGSFSACFPFWSLDLSHMCSSFLPDKVQKVSAQDQNKESTKQLKTWTGFYSNSFLATPLCSANNLHPNFWSCESFGNDTSLKSLGDAERVWSSGSQKFGPPATSATDKAQPMQSSQCI